MVRTEVSSTGKGPAFTLRYKTATVGGVTVFGPEPQSQSWSWACFLNTNMCPFVPASGLAMNSSICPSIHPSIIHHLVHPRHWEGIHQNS